MTFAQGVLRLVRSGVRVDSETTEPGSPAASETEAAEAGSIEVGLFAPDDALADSVAAVSHLEPGFADIEAAVALVESGLATRVVLTGFPSWPGLLWQAYQLAEAADVLILPTLNRPGGRVDIVIAREPAQHG
jgi:hypothetical protein